MRAVFDRDYNPGNLEVEGADYNIVQNNGTALLMSHKSHWDRL